MTKASPRRIAKKGKIAVNKRSLSPEECLELQEMHRLARHKHFEAAQVKGNTALIPKGQEVAEQLEAIARLLENAKNMWVAQKLLECGYPEGTKCSINMTTGAVLLEQ
jgi:hypothetical protein